MGEVVYLKDRINTHTYRNIKYTIHKHADDAQELYVWMFNIKQITPVFNYSVHGEAPTMEKAHRRCQSRIDKLLEIARGSMQNEHVRRNSKLHKPDDN